MNEQTVKDYLNICKENRQLVDSSLIETLKSMISTVAKAEFLYEEHMLKWELWFSKDSAWYQLEVAYRKNWIRLCLNNTVVIETELCDAAQRDGETIQELMDFLLDEVCKDIELMEQGLYHEKIVSRIPKSCRTGILIKKNFDAVLRVTSFSTKLTGEEIRIFSEMEKNEYRLIERPCAKLSIEDICRKISKEVKTCKNRTIPFGLQICKDEEGYFSKIICNSWEHMDDVIQLYLMMIAQELPVWLPGAGQIKDMIDGTERIAIIPENNTCENEALLFPPNTFVSGKTFLKDAPKVEFPDRIIWKEINDLKPISEEGGALLSLMIP